MRYTFEHSIEFRDGSRTAPYRSARWWKTSNGALRAAEKHAYAVGDLYESGSIVLHALVIRDDQGRFVTNEAA